MAKNQAILCSENIEETQAKNILYTVGQNSSFEMYET